MGTQGLVLGGAAVVSSPALYGWFVGEVSLTAALVRFLVCLVVTHLAVSVVRQVFWASSTPRPVKPTPLPPGHRSGRPDDGTDG